MGSPLAFEFRSESSGGRLKMAEKADMWQCSRTVAATYLAVAAVGAAALAQRKKAQTEVWAFLEFGAGDGLFIQLLLP